MKTFIKKDEFSILVQANDYNRHSAVLGAAAELFANNEHPSRSDLLHFEELFLRLLPKLDLRSKTEISERLSKCHHLPQAVAITLAKEDISVAAPILRHHYGFNDNDLLVILANGNQLHALAISSRERLSDKVTIALSQFKLDDFAPSETDEINSLSHSQGHESDQKAAPSVESDVAKRKIIKQAHVSPAKSDEFTIGLDAFLANEHAYVLSQMQFIEENARNKNVSPEAILHEAYNRAETALDFIKLAREKNASAFAELLAKQCAMSTADAKKIIDDSEGFALAICLKALALPKDVANEAFILLNPARATDVDQTFLLDWFYNQISPAGARSLVDNWREEKNSGLNVKNRSYQSVYDGKSYTNARPERVTRRARRTTRRTGTMYSISR